MAIALLDVNVLLALVWPSHEFHSAARAWYVQWAPQKWASCPLTQLAFIRLSSNPKILPYAVEPSRAAELLNKFIATPRHVFWPDSIPITNPQFTDMKLRGHKQITDAYLVALARSQRQKFATFDRAAASLLPQHLADDTVIVIPG